MRLLGFYAKDMLKQLRENHQSHLFETCASSLFCARDQGSWDDLLREIRQKRVHMVNRVDEYMVRLLVWSLMRISWKRS